MKALTLLVGFVNGAFMSVEVFSLIAKGKYLGRYWLGSGSHFFVRPATT